MKFALRRTLLPAIFALCVMPGARVAWSQSFDMEPGSGIEIRLAAAFETLPRAGFLPCRITIHNESDQPHTWTFSFSTAAGDYNRQSREILNRSFSAAPGQIVNYDVLMPICPSNRSDSTYRSPSVMISGAGVRTPSISLPSRGGSGRDETPFIAMSPALSSRSWNVVKTELEKHHSFALAGSEVNLELLGEDWRGLLGVGVFFLGAGEYSALRPAPRRAVLNWVAQGGNLILCGNEEVRDIDELSAGKVVEYEMGTVRRIPWDGESELNPGQTAELILGFTGELGDRLRDMSPAWIFAEALGHASRNIAFLAVFITIFAAAVGPLNLFWFAGANRRHRLFWTTPLISVGASMLLGAVILLQDGFGGSGVRMTLRYLLPSAKQMIVMQEQASRTGLLLARDFSTQDDLFLAPMSLPSRVDDWQGARNLEQGLRTYGGDWFRSRSAQGQFAETILPSRETVELVSAPGEAPEIRSSISVVLKNVYYLDAQGGRWHAENLRTGERLKLAPQAGGSEVDASIKTAGPMLRHAFNSIANQPGHFYALAENAPGIETLPSIRWKQDQTIYTGPVAIAP